MVYDLPRLLTTDLTDTTINRQSIINERLSCPAPCSTLIELLLIHRPTTSFRVSPPPTTPAYAMPAYNKEPHSQDIVLCGLFICVWCHRPLQAPLCTPVSAGAVSLSGGAGRSVPGVRGSASPAVHCIPSLLLLHMCLTRIALAPVLLLDHVEPLLQAAAYGY